MSDYMSDDMSDAEWDLNERFWDEYFRTAPVNIGEGEPYISVAAYKRAARSVAPTKEEYLRLTASSVIPTFEGLVRDLLDIADEHGYHDDEGDVRPSGAKTEWRGIDSIYSPPSRGSNGRFN